MSAGGSAQGAAAATGPGSKDDVDLFLTGVESKLRGPFSSLDLAKAVTTTTLRGSLTPAEYLDLISQVLARTDKVIQLRILIAMLGLDPSEETNSRIYAVLQQAQEAPLHEEWVRTVSGLIQGIMFYSADDGDDDHEGGSNGEAGKQNEDSVKLDSKSSRESCRGEEARKLLDKTCKDIIARVAKEIKKCNKKRDMASAERENEEEEGNRKCTNSHHKDEQHDMNPFFAPFRYALLQPADVGKLIPECDENPHFTANEDVEVLKIDDRLDLERTKEEKSHKPVTLASTAVAKAAAPVGAASVNLPGFRKTNKAPLTKSKAPEKKSSMFIPAKKPIASRTAGAQSVHVRKAGAAQALLAKNRMKQRMMGNLGMGSAPGGAAGLASRALGSKSKMLTSAAGKSKMKMIDVAEVDTLNKDHKDRDDKLAQEEKRNSRKRQIHEMAAKRGILGNKAKHARELSKKVSPILSKKAATPTPEPEPDRDLDPEPVPKTEKNEPQPPKEADDDSDDEGRDFGFGIQNNSTEGETAAVSFQEPRQEQQQQPVSSLRVQDSRNNMFADHGLSQQYGLDANTLLALQQRQQQQEQIRLQQQQELELHLRQQEIQLQRQQEQELHFQLQLRQERQLQEQRQLQERQLREQLLARQQAAVAAAELQQQAAVAAAELQHYQHQQRLQQQQQEQELHQYQQQQLLVQQYAQQQQQQQISRRSTATNDSWRILLQERSNKLSAEDRARVQQFFESQFNPTPDMPVYKMKLHEARTADPVTGQPIKETYYLELDYRTFTSRQSKKVKKY